MESTHTASEVRDLSGLTYRMLHVWEKAGLLPERQTAGSWRRFTPREMFMLFVLMDFRRRFQVPLPKLKYVRDFMLQDGADHLSAAVELMGTLGIPVYLATDFEGFFVMDSALEFHDLVGYGALPDGFAMICVNPIVKRILSVMRDPVEIDDGHGLGWRILHDPNLRHSETLTPDERRLLELARNDELSRIEVIKKDGAIHRFEFEKTFSADAECLAELLAANDTQRLTFRQLRGNLTSITQRVTEKVSARGQKELRLRSPQEAPDRDAAGKENNR